MFVNVCNSFLWWDEVRVLMECVKSDLVLCIGTGASWLQLLMVENIFNARFFLTLSTKAGEQKQHQKLANIF